jgi:uncharacterized protein
MKGAPAQRRCIVTGEVGDRALLMRFVLTPTGELVPDVAARLPGRGLWLTPRRAIVEKAVAKRVFAHAARRAVSVSPGLADRVEALLAERIVEALGLARRAGLAVAGFEKVREAVKSGWSSILLAALDGGESGRGKVGAMAREVPLVAALTATEMGAPFGRDRVAHVALGPGPLGLRILCDARKISGFRGGAVVIGARDGDGTGGA